jgi:hypothetical protein
VFHYCIFVWRRKAQGSRRKVWGSSKGRIFRIKTTLIVVAVRVAVRITKVYWNPLPSFPAGRREDRLHRRSRCGLKKSAMPSPFFGSTK